MVARELTGGGGGIQDVHTSVKRNRSILKIDLHLQWSHVTIDSCQGNHMWSTLR